MLCEEVILFSQRSESWSSKAMIAANKLSGFPLCSASSGTFYQSSAELRCILNTKPELFSYSSSVSSLRWGWLLLSGITYLEGTSFIDEFEDVCPLK